MKYITAFVALVVAVMIVGLNFIARPWESEASSHREAPRIATDPQVDGADLYAFRSPDSPDTATIIANWYPYQEPTGGPNFYRMADNARYLINIDRNGDGVPDIQYEWRFHTVINNPGTWLYNTGPITSVTSPNLNYRQFYTVTEFVLGASPMTTVLFANVPMVPANVGPRSTPNYAALAASAVNSLAVAQGTIREFTGPRADPFFADIGTIFDLGGLRPLNQAHLVPLAPAPGINSFAGYNVFATAIQVPRSRLWTSGCDGVSTTDSRCVIGVWSTAERRATRVLDTAGGTTESGAWVQVSRLGNPLINEVVIDLARKDAFNALSPVNDVAAAGDRILTSELASLMRVLYPGVTTPVTNRVDLLGVFAQGIPAGALPGLPTTQQANSVATPTEQLRLNLAVPVNPAGVCQGNRMGYLGGDIAGFPNGRRLEDDVVDIALRVVAGVLYQVYVPSAPNYNVSPNNILTDGVDRQDRPCLQQFPYVGTPSDGYTRIHANFTQNFVTMASRAAMSLFR